MLEESLFFKKILKLGDKIRLKTKLKNKNIKRMISKLSVFIVFTVIGKCIINTSYPTQNNPELSTKAQSTLVPSPVKFKWKSFSYSFLIEDFLLFRST